MSASPRIILYDGYCHLCHSTMQFIIKRDPHYQFQFAPLQSEAGKHLQQKHEIPTPNTPSKTPSPSTIILIENDRYYTKSTAVLRILKRLGGGWQLMYGFIIVPPPLRDICYNLIAHYRYQWFGKYDTCRLPASGNKHRFIEKADEIAN